MNFTSQICTTEEQSKRLLALGLKKETADCYYYAQQRWTGNSYENTGELFLSPLWNIDDKGHFQYLNEVFGDEIGEEDVPYVLPAWSLHRLLEMMPTVITHDDYPLILGVNATCVYYADNEYGETFKDFEGNLYGCIVNCIEWLIKEGYFNKEYLERI